ncbi:MAG: hypothetical protein WD896_02435 [Parcubacteria group bacterium]
MKWQTIKLRLSAGIRIPRWMKWLQNVEISYERVHGKRIRFIKFQRAHATFGQQGSVWLTLPEFRETLRYFPSTLQILGARGRVLENNIYLCLRCFTLSGVMLGESEVGPVLAKGHFTCTNKECAEVWTRIW